MWLRLMLAISLVFWVGAEAPAEADALEDIRARGQLRLGVKTDYPPFGYKKDGKHVGLDVDLARDLARRMGVAAALHPVVAVDRLTLLEEGRIEVVVATLTDTDARRRRVRMIEPHYYASGTNAITTKRRRIRTWAALSRKPVCGVRGAFYNQTLVDRLGIRLLAFVETETALQALRGGRCAAFVFDDTFLQGVLMTPTWRNYEMPFETTDMAPWAVAVAGGRPALAAFVREAVEDWHRSGLIQELEKRHGLKPSQFAAEMHQKYR